jgi:hypothetical protein
MTAMAFDAPSMTGAALSKMVSTLSKKDIIFPQNVCGAAGVDVISDIVVSPFCPSPGLVSFLLLSPVMVALQSRPHREAA